MDDRTKFDKVIELLNMDKNAECFTDVPDEAIRPIMHTLSIELQNIVNDI